MNIAFFIEQHFDPFAGGVQQSTSKLVKIFNYKRHKTIVISCSTPCDISIYDGSNVFHIGLNSIRFQEILYSEEIDLVINQAGYSFPLSKFLIQNLTVGVKLINTLRINPLNFYQNHKFIIKNFLEKKRLLAFNISLTQKGVLLYHVLKQRFELSYIIKNVDAFVMLSDRFKPELYQLVPGVKKYDKKIFGINNPFQKPELAFETIEKENVILFVGRLEISQKRVDLLLEIWMKLHKELPNWQFWVVGHGAQEKMMKNFCQEHGLINVKFFGKCKPDNYYLQAKILHMTSSFEGFGNVLVEAQCYGCVPILFNSYSAASDIINHDEDGVLIKSFDIQDYVDATLRLSNNNVELKRLSENAYQNADRFAFYNIYKKWDNVFSSL
ncbi:glycosyltransferase [Rhodonellum sp.]|uniref:glycosyltransferase n=1 Tax=Rhodonellum sp. TaxID=2231180 RepID=UPI002718F5D3|nr:glycosyltransferase [Rhodonellum sp.]MDO9551549.1 glycosyltransferase [Rhodonellum sp.]